jgi:hypothetical protein
MISAKNSINTNSMIMRSIYPFLFLFVLILTTPGYGQGFVNEVEEDGLSALFGNPCTILLANGDKIAGKLSSGSGTNGYLSAITIKLENDEKVKLKAEDITRLTIKVSKFAKLTMVSESAESIKEMTKTDFNNIVKRDSVIYETAMQHTKGDKIRLMQLLNPGFDSKLKVFADPNPNRETSGIGIAGVKLTGGIDKSYLFVQNSQKAILVKKGSYKKNFEELYKNCPAMVAGFTGEKIKWEDVAGHVFAYDQICKD